MASSGDIRAGRAAVELVLDPSALETGLKKAEQSIKNVDKNVGAMRAGMLANQFAVGLQDFAVVYDQSKDLGRALSAAANNAIQLMTLINPMAGALTAAAIAGYQLYTAFSKAGSSAKALRDEVRGIAEGIGRFGAANNEGGKADEARKIQQEWAALARESDTLAEKRNQAAARRDALVRDNTNVLGFQMDNPEATAAIAREDALIAELDKKKQETDAKLKENEALQQQIKPEATAALLEDARKKAQARTKEEKDKQKAEDEEEARMEAEASQIWSGVKRQEDQWKIDTEERRQKIAEDQARDAERELEKRRSQAESVTRQFETPSERRARMMAEYKGMLNAGDIGKDTYDRAIASLNQRSESVTGTFSGAALGGLSASSPLVAIQRATEETAKNTRKRGKGASFD